MSEKVVGLRGRAVIDGRKPVETVVELLEAFAEMARSGEIVGVVAVVAYHDEATGGRRAGFNSYSMVGRIEDLKQRILEDLAQ